MASYPGSIKSFTSKNSLDVIQASHINDLQDEVNAVETGLLNGLAHALTVSTGGLTVSTGSVNVGGPSSLTTLQVTGGSTFAGPVTLSSGATISSGGLTLSTGVIRQNSLPMWSVFHSTHVAYASGSTTGAIYDSQDFVRGDIAHSTGTNSSRVTVNTTGVYAVDYQALVRSSGGPNLAASVVFNDATVLLRRSYIDRSDDSRRGHLTVGGRIRVSSTGYLTVQIQSVDAASTSGSSSPFDALRFSGHFLG